MTSIDFYLLSHTIPAEYLCRIFPAQEADRQSGTPGSRLRKQRRHSLPSLYFFNFFLEVSWKGYFTEVSKDDFCFQAGAGVVGRQFVPAKAMG
jgi:hypothetical protein